MQISEHYAWIPETKQRENSPLLPKSLRAVIVGKKWLWKDDTVDKSFTSS